MVSPRARRALSLSALVTGGVAVLIAASVAVAAATRSEITLTNDSSSYSYDVAFSPDGTKAYVTDNGRDQVFIIDVATASVEATVPGSSSLISAAGLAVTETHVFVAGADSNVVGALNRSSNTYDAFIPIPSATGSNNVSVVRVDPGSGRGYALARDSNVTVTGLGSLTAFDVNALSVVGAPVTGLSGANDVALSRDGQIAYVASYTDGVFVVDTTTSTVTRTIGVGGRSVGAVAVDPRGGYLYVYSAPQRSSAGVSFNELDRVDVVDIDSGTVARSVSVGQGFLFNRIVVSPDGTRAFVSNRWGWTATEIDVSDPLAASVVTTFAADRAYGIGISASGAHVYTNTDTNPPKVMALTMATPGAPTAATAVAGEERATITWVAPTSDGGAPVLSYTVASVEDPAKTCRTEAALPTAAPTTCTINGLTAGRSYSFTVTARNGIGDGPASNPSNAVVPTAAPGPEPGPAPGPSPSGEPALRVGIAMPKVVRVGRVFSVRVRVANAASRDGGSAASGMSVCVRLAPGVSVVRARGASVSGRSVCWRDRSLAAGSRATYTVRLQASRSAGKALRVPLRVDVSAAGSSSERVRKSARGVMRVVPSVRPEPVTG